jgi:hypothetical protein
VDASAQRCADEVVHGLRDDEGREAGGDDAPRRADDAVELPPRNSRMRVDEERDVAGEERRAGYMPPGATRCVNGRRMNFCAPICAERTTAT